MEYKIIVRQTMFDFKEIEKGRVQLQSVKFMREGNMKKKNNLLLITEKNKVQFFINGSTPIAKLSREQFRFVTAVARFFGYLPDQKQLPVWLWADSLELQSDSVFLETVGAHPRLEPALC